MQDCSLKRWAHARRERKAVIAIEPAVFPLMQRALNVRCCPHCGLCRQVRFVPTRDSCSAASGLLFNHLVGESEHRRRRLKAGQSSRLAIQTWLAAAPAVLQDPYPKNPVHVVRAILTRSLVWRHSNIVPDTSRRHTFNWIHGSASLIVR
jgi:hypothetical protein